MVFYYRQELTILFINKTVEIYYKDEREPIGKNLWDEFPNSPF